MKWEFDSDRAIYSQIVEQMQLFIISGLVAPGDKLASVRDLASEAGVNPNTMQRALTELEKIGLVFSNRTSGRFVTEDTDVILENKNRIAQKKIDSFFGSMEKLGYTKQEIKELITGR